MKAWECSFVHCDSIIVTALSDLQSIPLHSYSMSNLLKTAIPLFSSAAAAVNSLLSPRKEEHDWRGTEDAATLMCSPL